MRALDMNLPIGHAGVMLDTISRWCHSLLEAHGSHIGVPPPVPPALSRHAAAALLRESMEHLPLQRFRPFEGDGRGLPRRLVRFFAHARSVGLPPQGLRAVAESYRSTASDTLARLAPLEVVDPKQRKSRSFTAAQRDAAALGDMAAAVDELAASMEAFDHILAARNAATTEQHVELAAKLLHERAGVADGVAREVGHLVVDDLAAFSPLGVALIARLAPYVPSCVITADDAMVGNRPARAAARS